MFLPCLKLYPVPNLSPSPWPARAWIVSLGSQCPLHSEASSHTDLPRKLTRLLGSYRQNLGTCRPFSLEYSSHFVWLFLLMIRSQLNGKSSGGCYCHTHTYTGLGWRWGDTLVTSYCFSSNKKAYSGSVVYPTVSVLSMCQKHIGWMLALQFIRPLSVGNSCGCKEGPTNNSGLTK